MKEGGETKEEEGRKPEKEVGGTSVGKKGNPKQKGRETTSSREQTGKEQKRETRKERKGWHKMGRSDDPSGQGPQKAKDMRKNMRN